MGGKCHGTVDGEDMVQKWDGTVEGEAVPWLKDRMVH